MTHAATEFTPAALWTVLASLRDCGSVGRTGHPGHRDHPGDTDKADDRELPVAIAFSGGLDSTVLLHSCTQLRDLGYPLSLRALHVNHGLHPDSAAWSAACAQVAHSLRIPFVALKATIRMQTGDSLEAEARTARYAALQAALLPGEHLATAHHADDQLETVLLQLLRGAGPAGLAGMPLERKVKGTLHIRPMLAFTHARIRQWALGQALAWLDDPSNLDERHARNYLRHRVLPLLRERWPGAAGSVSRSAKLSGVAGGLLRQLGDGDLEGVEADGCLLLAPLLALGEARATNAMRCWLSQAGLPLPSRARISSLWTSLCEAGPSALPLLSWTGGEVRCWRGQLYAAAAPPPEVPDEFRWHEGATLALGEGLGSLALTPVEGPGLAARCLEQASLSVTFRVGGERLQPSGSPHHRTLKNLLQEQAVVPWMRGHVPLLRIGGQIAAVGEWWIEDAFAARTGEPAVALRWIDHPRLH